MAAAAAAAAANNNRMLVSSTTRSATEWAARRQSSASTSSATSSILLCDITASDRDTTPRSTASSTSTVKTMAARRSAGNGNKVTSSTTQLTAQELVASFKTMTYSSGRPHPPPLPSPPPPQPPQPQPPPSLNPLNPRSNDDAFTIIDCMSIFLSGGGGGGGGGGFGGGGRGGDDGDGDRAFCSSFTTSSSSQSLSRRRRHCRAGGGGGVNLDAALNTVSSSCGGESSERGWRRPRSHRASRRRQHRGAGYHSRHHRSAKDARDAAASTAAPAAPGGQSGRRQHRHRRENCRRRRRSHRGHRRRCLDCFECFAADPLVAEATPVAAAPVATCASAGVQRSEATCRIFLSSSCPQPRWAPAARCQPSLTAVAAARSASPSPSRRCPPPPPHPWSQQQQQPQKPQTQSSSLWFRRDVVGHGGGCGCAAGGRDGEWPRRGASSNCNAEASCGFHMTGHHQCLQHRMRNLHREAEDHDAVVEEEEEEEGGAASTDESLYISASTASLTARSLLRGYRRHLRTPQAAAACHRVWVPAGANAGQPPPRLPQQRPGPAAAATAAASVVCTGLTRTATRTARSVSRQLRAVLFSGRRRLLQATDASDRLLPSPPLAPAPPPPLRPPPSSPPQSPSGAGTSSASPSQQQQPQRRRRRPHRLPRANSNRQRHPDSAVAAATNCANCRVGGYCGDEYSSLMKTIERSAQHRQSRRWRHSTRSDSNSSTGGSNIELELAAAADSEPTTDCRTVALISPAGSTTMTDSATVRPGSPSPSSSSSPSSPRAARQHSASAAGENNPALRRKVDSIINTMSDSLVGLSHSLQGCVGHLHGTLAQLRSDARKYT